MWFLKKIIRNNILFSLDVLNYELVLRKPIFEMEKLLLMNTLILELHYSWERSVIKPDDEVMANKTKFKFLDAIFDN